MCSIKLTKNATEHKKTGKRVSPLHSSLKKLHPVGILYAIGTSHFMSALAHDIIFFSVCVYKQLHKKGSRKKSNKKKKKSS